MANRAVTTRPPRGDLERQELAGGVVGIVAGHTKGMLRYRRQGDSPLHRIIRERRDHLEAAVGEQHLDVSPVATIAPGIPGARGIYCRHGRRRVRCARDRGHEQMHRPVRVLVRHGVIGIGEDDDRDLVLGDEAEVRLETGERIMANASRMIAVPAPVRSKPTLVLMNSEQVRCPIL